MVMGASGLGQGLIAILCWLQLDPLRPKYGCAKKASEPSAIVFYCLAKNIVHCNSQLGIQASVSLFFFPFCKNKYSIGHCVSLASFHSDVFWSSCGHSSRGAGESWCSGFSTVGVGGDETVSEKEPAGWKLLLWQLFMHSRETRA